MRTRGHRNSDNTQRLRPTQLPNMSPQVSSGASLEGGAMASVVAVPVVPAGGSIPVVERGRSRHCSVQRSNEVSVSGRKSGAGRDDRRSMDGGAGLGGDARNNLDSHIAADPANTDQTIAATFIHRGIVAPSGVARRLGHAPSLDHLRRLGRGGAGPRGPLVARRRRHGDAGRAADAPRHRDRPAAAGAPPFPVGTVLPPSGDRGDAPVPATGREGWMAQAQRREVDAGVVRGSGQARPRRVVRPDGRGSRHAVPSPPSIHRSIG